MHNEPLAMLIYGILHRMPIDAWLHCTRYATRLRSDLLSLRIPNAKGDTLLTLAARHGNADAAAALLKAGSSVYGTALTGALYIACLQGHVEIALSVLYFM